MIDIEEVISRLEVNKARLGQKGTDGAASYEEVKGRAPKTPFLHVIPTFNKPYTPEDTGMLSKVFIKPEFDLIYTLRNVREQDVPAIASCAIFG